MIEKKIKNTFLMGAAGIFTACNVAQDKNTKPNIILILNDDLGYADLSCFGATKHRTPNIDEMAKEGIRFTDFYVTSPSSAPSRCALLTGSYPARNYTEYGKPINAISNITDISEINRNQVDDVDKLFLDSLQKNVPGSKFARHPCGFNPSETTMAEMLRDVGYRTVMYGKWHLGEQMRDHPIHHGFDEYWGVTASISVRPDYQDPYAKEHRFFYPNQALFYNDSVIEYNPDFSQLTKRYTEKALQYIEKNKRNTFFMFFSHAMPHIPIGASAEFLGKTKSGIYSDVIAEIDWSAGEIIKKLKQCGIDKNTLVIFTSDNGPWLAYGDHAGSAQPLREGKGTRFEGGVRVPCIMYWPDKIKAGSVNQNSAMSIDLMPTFAEIAGATLPSYEIDGKSMLPMLLDANKKSSQEAYLFYGVGNLPGRGKDNDIYAIRKDNWKLLLPQKYISLDGKEGGKNGNPVKMHTLEIDTALFDLSVDKYEKVNLAATHPKIVKELIELAKIYNDNLQANRRTLRWVEK